MIEIKVLCSVCAMTEMVIEETTCKTGHVEIKAYCLACEEARNETYNEMQVMNTKLEHLIEQLQENES